MLNLNVNVDVKQSEYPIFFDGKNECVNCGSVNCLEFIDKFGNRHRDEIKAFDHIKCKCCGKIFSILWQKSKDSNRMYPSAVEANIGRDFVNMVNGRIKLDGTKKFIN